MRTCPVMNIIAVSVASLCVATCGTYVPRMEEAWEPIDVPENMEYRIKAHIFCETVKALRDARTRITVDGRPAIPDSFGVQMQISLTVEESGGVNPGITLNRTLANVLRSGVPVGQTTNVGLGANLSSTATRTDTSYSYYNVGKLSAPGKNEFCFHEEAQHGSSPLLQSELGIKNYLAGAALQEQIFPSSTKPSKNKDAKLDIYSYDVKFVVVSNGNVNPSWKLVDISANTASTPFLTAGRNRTHEMVLTFGPGEAQPSSASLSTHFNTQLVQSLDRIRAAIPQ